jgi:DNA-binding transcriptional LysR family regulator
MDRLEAMTILLRVVDRGSFSAAGRELGVPLATVSRKVSELEAHLGTRLLARTTRRVVPTDAGAAYVAAARRILDQLGEAERIAAGEFHTPRGALTLTAPVCFGRLHVLPVVSEFLAAYPEITVRLHLSDRFLHLIDEHVDLAARIGVLAESSLVALRVGTMRTVVCASPGLLAAHGVPATPQDVTRLPCVNFDALSPAAIWSFRRPGETAPAEVAILPRLSVSTAEAAVAAACAGVGVTRVLHYQCAKAVRAGSLRIVLEAFEPAPLPVQVIHAAQGALPWKLRVFLDFAGVRLRRSLAAL